MERRQFALPSIAVLLALVLVLGAWYYLTATGTYPPDGSGCPIAPPYCPGYPMVTAGYLSGPHMIPYGMSCALDTGVCNVTLRNNGTPPEYNAFTDACLIQVVIFKNATVTTVDQVNGTNSGPAAASIPIGTEATGTCTVATSNLTLMTPGMYADGCFIVRLLSHLDKSAYACFEGSWS